MPLTTSTTDRAINKLIRTIAEEYKPLYTGTKPLYKIEQLFTEALQEEEIKKSITKYILTSINDYE